MHVRNRIEPQMDLDNKSHQNTAQSPVETAPTIEGAQARQSLQSLDPRLPRAARQSAMLQIQRSRGNSFVLRMLGKTPHGTIQRDSQTKRGLNSSERTEAAKVYGTSLNYDAIVLEDAPVMSIGGYARTTPWTVNFPTGTLAGGGPSITWLMHELGHSWQYAPGVSMIRTLFHAVKGVYDYGGEAAIRKAITAGLGLNSFNTEQQAEIAKDSYLEIVGGRDLTAYQPFIDEFKSGQYQAAKASPAPTTSTPSSSNESS